jgi:hypothetical protein
MSVLFSWFDKFMMQLGRKSLILDRNSSDPYLTRYYVFLRDRKKFPFNVFVHKFHKSDEITPHDHPWPYATLILSGGYWEYIPQFSSDGIISYEIGKWRGPGHFRICSSKSYHRIELKPGVTPWTLFMPGPQRRSWGFLTKSGWIPHNEYLTDKAHNT